VFVLNRYEAAFVRAYMVARSADEVANRMANLITPNEVLDKVRALRRRGLHLPLVPGAEARPAAVTLTRHPEDCELYVDEDGRTAFLLGPTAPSRSWEHADGPEEGPWPCDCCDRLASAAWCVIGQGEEARTAFACLRCVAVVD
jgi:hypothetical protein